MQLIRYNKVGTWPATFHRHNRSHQCQNLTTRKLMRRRREVKRKNGWEAISGCLLKGAACFVETGVMQHPGVLPISTKSKFSGSVSAWLIQHTYFLRFEASGNRINLAFTLLMEGFLTHLDGMTVRPPLPLRRLFPCQDIRILRNWKEGSNPKGTPSKWTGSNRTTEAPPYCTTWSATNP